MSLDEEGSILIQPLLKKIEDMKTMYEHIVSYYSDTDEAFVIIGKYPLANNFGLHPGELDPSRPLRIRLELPPNY